MTFNEWLDTFISEKDLDLEQVFEVEGPDWGTNYIPARVVVEHIQIASPAEQMEIKNMLVKIDFHNGDVMDFFKHLAKAIAI